MYEDGEGTPVDNDEAQKWFELAAKNGVEKADQKLLKLASVEQANSLAKNGLVQTCPNIVDVLKSTDWKFSFEDDRWVVGEGKDTFSMDVEEDLCSFSMFAYLGELGDADLIFSNEYNKENSFGYMTAHDGALFYEHHLVLPNASDKLLKLNMALFKAHISKALEEMRDAKVKAARLFS